MVTTMQEVMAKVRKQLVRHNEWKICHRFVMIQIYIRCVGPYLGIRYRRERPRPTILLLFSTSISSRKLDKLANLVLDCLVI